MTSDRREFLKSALAGAPAFVPNSARGANDRPAYGLIGSGGRGRWLSRAFQQLGAQCVALSDVYEPHLELARKESPAGVRRHVNYRDLLAEKGIDFVVIATPDHHHCPNLLAALDAGKDVYLEKPLSLNLEESARMVQAVRNSRQIVQVGMQRRSMEFCIEVKKLVDEGALGKVSMVKALWNWHFAKPIDNSPLAGKIDWGLFLGSAKKRPLEPRRLRWWRGFWDYSGGNMTDQGTHLMDVAQWMTSSGPPRAAVCHGYLAKMTGAEVPDVFSAVFEYPDFMATWTLNYASSYENDWSIQFQGDRGAMIMDRTGARIYDEPGLQEAPWNLRGAPKLVRELPERGAGVEHQQNFLDSIRSRRQPNCPVETAAAAVAGPHLANLALLRETRVKLPGRH
ncbi:MAG: Gfo/Idh/MocA family oxidoreductase [Acidobacteriota bacterium]